jgi:predicted HTH transcriptional regulator
LVPEEVKTLTLNMFRATLPSTDDKIVRELIKGLETDKIEFKEGAAFNSQRNQKSPDMIKNVLREIAGFFNSGGGNVILGVTDKGKLVGITDDLQHADSKKRNRDGYELFLRNSISGKLGTIQSSSCKISFHKIDNLEVCRIFVPASPAPVYLDGNLIIRDGTSSRQLSTQEAANYVGLHWPQV